MKLLAVVLLACLLVTGTVSAITMYPGAVATTRKINPVTVVVTQTTSPDLGPATGAADNRAELLVYSVPAGAAITLDGTAAGDVTPKYYRLPPGQHTVELLLSGYQDYFEIIHLNPHELRSIHADLKQKPSASAMAAAAVSKKVWITVNIDSVPSNATVTQVRSGTVFGKTPLTLNLSPDTYWVTVSYPLYQDKTISFSQNQDIMVTLEPLNAGPMTAEKAKAAETLWWGSGITPANQGLNASDYQHWAQQTTPLDIRPCPKDWSCLTPAEAKQQFGLYAMYGNTPCGLEDNPGSPLHLATIKYCCRDSSLGTLPQGALAAGDIREGDDIYIVNDTWIEHAVVNKSPAEHDNGEGGLLQPIFRFFSDLFGGSKPEGRLLFIGSSAQPPEGSEAGRFK